MNNTSFPGTVVGRFFPLIVLALIFSWLMSSCNDDDDMPQGPAFFAKNKVMITGIVGIPSHVAFDKVRADIQGASWKVIASVEAPYEHGEVALELPSGFSSDELQKVVRTDLNDLYGYWPWHATSSNPDALVASLGNLIAYDGDIKVGRIYLTDWEGKGSSAGRGFIYYHYTDRPYQLSGYDKSYKYSASFKKGWNAFININPADEETIGGITCTTSIPHNIQTCWRFESWVKAPSPETN